MSFKKHIIMFCITASIILIFQFQELYCQCSNKLTTVIISLDGFRWDYPQKTYTPSLDLIAKEGTKAVSLIPSFPTKTFPNHYTIATGLVPDHHGIVNNSFYDPEIKKLFSMSGEGRFDPEFYGGEPIWITAQKQRVRTASFFWVGSDVAIQGRHPDYWKQYNGNVPYLERIDTIVKWLQIPFDQRPKLIMAYFEEPDGAGHNYGPENPKTLKMVQYMDSIVGVLYDRIRKLPDGECINIVVVSDHGMGSVSTEKNIVLSELLLKSWGVRIQGGNPFYNLYIEDPFLDSVYFSLKKTPHLNVWKSKEVPAYLNYGTNPRTGDIIIVSDSSWSVTIKKPYINSNSGTHGYDIKNSDMYGIFYASGPSFKKNYIHPSFKNTNIYPLLAHILEINPANNDGDLNEVKEMLR